jgi:hypothetical protein
MGKLASEIEQGSETTSMCVSVQIEVLASLASLVLQTVTLPSP